MPVLEFELRIAAGSSNITMVYHFIDRNFTDIDRGVSYLCLARNYQDKTEFFGTCVRFQNHWTGSS